MTLDERFKITSNDYIDLIFKYTGSLDSLKKYEKYSVHIINDFYAVIYVPVSEITTQLVKDLGYSSMPKCYGLTSDVSLDASGVNQLKKLPNFNLKGKGVAIGIIDTGIDYTNPVFQHEDGTTRIHAIWDQTIDSENFPDAIFSTFYGTEYTEEQINEALKSEIPLQIVPSMDENGHGTMLAGIAAGSENKQNEFVGVAPEAGLIVVKLKQVKESIRRFYSIPENVPCYQENDMIWALQYLIYEARKRKLPLAVCIGLGTSQGAHDNSGLLNSAISLAGDFPGVAISVSAGNEGNTKNHFYGTVIPEKGPVPVDLHIGENENGFTMELWGDPPMVYTLDILSPSDEYISFITEKLEESKEIRYIFDKTVIKIDYFLIEQETGKQVIVLRFENPTQGLWKFKVFGSGSLEGSFHIWLPIQKFVAQNTGFINPNPFTTITSPGNCNVPITVTAYNSSSGTLNNNSSRGFSTSNIINPDLAAPGDSITCPGLNHQFTSLSGTGAATAHTTGITAMMLEWGIVQNNYLGVDTIGIKKFLIRGAERSPNYRYPNREWGFGKIDIYNTFDILRKEI